MVRKVTLGAMLCCSAHLLCQTPASAASADAPYVPHLAFDVVSIHEYHPHPGGMRGPATNPPFSGYYEVDGASVPGLISQVYKIKPFQILNLPSWTREHMYTIVGKSDPSMDETLLKLGEEDAAAEKLHMVQQMLADRFHLKMHRETREGTIYELVRTARTAERMKPMPVDGKTVSTCSGNYSVKGVEIDGKGCPFNSLLSHIEGTLQMPLIDNTGMNTPGTWYAFHLVWNPREASTPEQDAERYPRLVDAIREQLGLELKKTRGPVTDWVVDHVDRPTEN